MLAARQQDPAQLWEVYRDIESLVLTIDGLQPEKGHETLQEVRRLIVVARQWAERLDQPVRGWMSDKQDACVTAIADEFVGTPHRYCQNHFLRDLDQPVLDIDSRAKVKMRRKVRGLRAIERRVLAERRQAALPEPLPPDEGPKTNEPPRAGRSEAAAPCASSDPGLVPTDSVLEATGLATTGDAP